MNLENYKNNIPNDDLEKYKDKVEELFSRQPETYLNIVGETVENLKEGLLDRYPKTTDDTPAEDMARELITGKMKYEIFTPEDIDQIKLIETIDKMKQECLTLDTENKKLVGHLSEENEKLKTLGDNLVMKKKLYEIISSHKDISQEVQSMSLINVMKEMVQLGVRIDEGVLERDRLVSAIQKNKTRKDYLERLYKTVELKNIENKDRLEDQN